jgi:anti-anti-sigma regulatory factor
MAGKAAKPAAMPLKGDLDIFSIQGQATGLKASLSGPGPFLLDLSGLGDVDLSGIQLLVSASVGRDKGMVRVKGIPPALADRMRELGLEAYLQEVQS